MSKFIVSIIRGVKAGVLMFVLFFVFSSCSNNNNSSISTSNQPNNTDTNKQSNLVSTTPSVTNSPVISPNGLASNGATQSAVLIGLSREKDKFIDDYRSIWIYREGDGFKYIVGDGFVITPVGDTFYKLANDEFNMSKKTQKPIYPEEPNNIQNFEYKYSFSNIASHKVSDKLKPLFSEKDFAKNPTDKEGESWPYREFNQKLLFAGNHYAIVKQNVYETGGGTYRSTQEKVVVYEIPDMSLMEKRKNGFPLKAILGNGIDDVIKSISKSNNKIIEEGFQSLKEAVHPEDFFIERNSGMWKLQIPIFEEYQHQGNGSNALTIKDVKSTDFQLPEKLISHDSSFVQWDNVLKLFPNVIDILASPTKDFIVLQFPNDIKVFKPENLEKKTPELVISTQQSNGAKENIILVQWSSGKFVENWTGVLKKYMN